MPLTPDSAVLLVKLAYPPEKDSQAFADFRKGLLTFKNLFQKLNPSWKEFTRENVKLLVDENYIRSGKKLITEEGQTVADKLKSRFDVLSKGIKIEERKQFYSDDAFQGVWWKTVIQEYGTDDLHLCGTAAVAFMLKPFKRIATNIQELTAKQEASVLETVKSMRKAKDWTRVHPLLFQVEKPGGFKLIHFFAKDSKQSDYTIQAKFFDLITKLTKERTIIYETTPNDKRSTIMRARLGERTIALLLPVINKKGNYLRRPK